jgi:hypothetical protein
MPRGAIAAGAPGLVVAGPVAGGRSLAACAGSARTAREWLEPLEHRSQQ